MTFGPVKLGTENKEGILHNLAVETVGGGANGSVADSDDVDCSIFVDRTADGIVEKMVADTSPDVTKTISAPGRPRGNAIKRKVRGAYAGIRISNDTAGETWGLEKIIINGKEKGRVR